MPVLRHLRHLGLISQNLTIKIHSSEYRLYFGLIRKLIKLDQVNSANLSFEFIWSFGQYIHLRKDSKQDCPKVLVNKCEVISNIFL